MLHHFATTTPPYVPENQVAKIYPTIFVTVETVSTIEVYVNPTSVIEIQVPSVPVSFVQL
jgi:hypothetical protein